MAVSEGESAVEAQQSFALEHTPTWAVAVVCIVFIALSLLMQRGLQRLGTFLLSSHKKPLYEALEKMKEELMLLGFISLLLTAAQNPISRMCMPESWADQMLPCHFHGRRHETSHNPPAMFPHSPPPLIHNLMNHRVTMDQQHMRKLLNWPNHKGGDESRRVLSGMTTPHLCSKGHVPILSTESLHQLHIFIFVMAVVHVFYSCFTMLFGFTQLRSWKKWEEETNVDNYNYTDEIKKSFNEEKFHKIRKMGLGLSLRRQSTFITSRTMNPWSANAYGIWFNSFFRQFGKSVTKSDYLTLRLGFIQNHNAPMKFNFYKYMMNSLEDDLKTVIGISGYLWVFVIFFMIINVHGWYAYFWMSFIPVLINLVIGTKLQHIITQLALETAHVHGIVNAAIKPRDELFWFNNPHLLLYLIHFVLFQNAFELAFCIWLVTTFGLNSCFFAKHGFIISRVIVGILAQVLCSYSTLPLYALVSQMGSHYKKAIFADPVSNAVTDWRNKAKANVKQLRHNRKSFELSESESHSSHSHGGVSHPDHHPHDHHHHHHHHSCLHVEASCVESDHVHVAHADLRSQTVSFLASDKEDSLQDQKPLTHLEVSKTLLPESLMEYCRECVSLSLAPYINDNDREENLRHNDTNEGSTSFPSKIKKDWHGVKNTKKEVYLKISIEETINGPPCWSLECGECRSLRALIMDSRSNTNEGDDSLQLLKNIESLSTTTTEESVVVSGLAKPTSLPIHHKKRSIFLKMARFGTNEGLKSDLRRPIEIPRKPNLLARPSLERLRRLPSRELSEIRYSESTHVLDSFREELDIPKLMLCNSLVSESSGTIDFLKSNPIVTKMTTTVALSSSPCKEVSCEVVETTTSNSFSNKALDGDSSHKEVVSYEGGPM